MAAEKSATIIAGQLGRSEAQDAKRKELLQAQFKAIMAANPYPRMLLLPRANHYVFQTNEADVISAMHGFIASLP